MGWGLDVVGTRWDGDLMGWEPDGVNIATRRVDKNHKQNTRNKFTEMPTFKGI